MASRGKQAEPRPVPRLYLITPPVADVAGFEPQLTQALASADVAAVLLRLATGDERTLTNRIKALAPTVQNTGAALLIDGRADLVARGGADGAHLAGIDAFNAALEQLKPERIAGAGGLTSGHDVMLAAEAGADYVMFGDTDVELAATKDRVNWCAELFEMPCAAYARIATEIEPVVAAGADFIALDYVWRDSRGAEAAMREAAECLRRLEPAQ